MLSLNTQTAKTGPRRCPLVVYLTKQESSPDVIATVENPRDDSFWTGSTMSPILLLHGLLAECIENAIVHIIHQQDKKLIVK